MPTRSSKESPVSQNSLAEKGEWKVLPYNSQVEAVHLVLLPTGKVLYCSGNREYEAIKTETRLWNPETGAIKDPTTPEDIFCAGHSSLPDGRVLSTGGTMEIRTKLPPWLARLFRPVTQLFASIGALFGVGNPTLLTGHTVLYIFNHKTEHWEDRLCQVKYPGYRDGVVPDNRAAREPTHTRDYHVIQQSSLRISIP